MSKTVWDPDFARHFAVKNIGRNNVNEVPYPSPKLKFYLFPLTRPTLKKGPTQKKYFNFQSRISFLNFIATGENFPM